MCDVDMYVFRVHVHACVFLYVFMCVFIHVCALHACVFVYMHAHIVCKCMHAELGQEEMKLQRFTVLRAPVVLQSHLDVILQ